jgi:magnesium-protoporphyrin O-methyltransferase
MTAVDDKPVDDKRIVQDYFNATGFERWQRIYGDGEVNFIQRNIRIGHQRTVDTVLAWLQADGDIDQRSFCDAGCGVGSLAIPLAELGAKQVYATDISEKMVSEGAARAKELLGDPSHLTFAVKDLEALEGQYDTVTCLDVLIHYPQDKAEEMIAHLSSVAERRLMISFAPKTLCLTLLKQVGQLFPGPSKTTRAYQHAEADLVRCLEANGWTVQRRAFNKAPFYFSQLLEAGRTA